MADVTEVVPLPDYLKECGCVHATAGMHATTCRVAREFDAIPLSEREGYEPGRRFRAVSWVFPLENSMPERGDYVTRLAPVDTWPDLRVTVHLLPWSWRIKPDFYVDDVDGAKGHWSFSWWFLAIEWWGNKRLFTELRAVAPAVQPPAHTAHSGSES